MGVGADARARGRVRQGGAARDPRPGPGLSYSVDANVLLYARNAADPSHDRARDWLESALNGETRVGLPWSSLGAFLRIATNPRAFPDPLTAAEAWQQVEEWLDAPRAWVSQPSTRFREILGRLVRDHQVTGPLFTDAQLAALAIDHREGQEAVQGEELAGLQHRGRLGDGDDLPDHDVGQSLVRRVEQQP